MNSIKKFILELNRPQSQISIPVMLGDTAREWHISFSDNGKGCNLEGMKARVQIKHPDGGYIDTICEIIDNTTVVYDFGKMFVENYIQTASMVGIHYCDVVLYNSNNQIVASAHFTMVVTDRVLTDSDFNYEQDDYIILDAMMVFESQRQDNEQERITNEIARQNAELLRVEAEAQRVANEEERIANENARKTRSEELFNAMADTVAEVENKRDNGEFDGEDGDDGFSPTITVTSIDGGHRVTITDANGTKSFDIKDGAQGDVGSVAEYTVKTELDKENYVLTVSLIDSNGNVVASDTVDFPLESVVVGGDEKDGIVTLTLINGNTIQFDIGDLVAGLVSTTTFEAKVKRLEESINASELSANKVNSLSSDSTDTQYPSAKCVYNELKAIRESIPTYTTAEGVSF